MKTGLYALLEVYEELREDARLKNDGEAFLFFCGRCSEVLKQIEDEKKENK